MKKTHYKVGQIIIEVDFRKLRLWPAYLIIAIDHTNNEYSVLNMSNLRITELAQRVVHLLFKPI